MLCYRYRLIISEESEVTRDPAILRRNNNIIPLEIMRSLVLRMWHIWQTSALPSIIVST